MQEQIYKVVVNDEGTFWYNSDNKLHRLDGPAVEYANGCKKWWIDGKYYTEAEWKKKVEELTKPKATCENKTVIFDGVRYKLILAD